MNSHSSLSLGKRLQEQRELLGLTQEKFAQLLGIAKRTQAHYEGDGSEPKAGYLAAASALGVDVMYVMTGQPTLRPADSLSVMEAKVIDNYRALPDEDQASVRRLTDALAQSAGKNEVKKKSGE